MDSILVIQKTYRLALTLSNQEENNIYSLDSLCISLNRLMLIYILILITFQVSLHQLGKFIDWHDPVLASTTTKAPADLHRNKISKTPTCILTKEIYTYLIWHLHLNSKFIGPGKDKTGVLLESSAYCDEVQPILL